MAYYDMRCNGCDAFFEGVVIPIVKLDEYKATQKCEKCGETKLRVSITNVPPVEWRGDGWSNAWTQTNYKNPQGESQRRLDATLRENDALTWASKNDPKYIKRGDDMERQATAMGWKE